MDNELKRRGPEMFENETPEQVHLTITTDYGYTADFLRTLANAIEMGGEMKTLETYRGVADIEWPE